MWPGPWEGENDEGSGEGVAEQAGCPERSVVREVPAVKHMWNLEGRLQSGTCGDNRGQGGPSPECMAVSRTGCCWVY